MKSPTVRTAEHMARAAGGDGAIVIVFEGDGFAGASWGATVPRCHDLGGRLDAIVDALNRGELAGPPSSASIIVAEEWEEFVGEGQDLLSALDDLPERAEDFAASAREKLEGMIEWAKEHRHVTERMQSALSGISGGIDRWER